MTEVRREALWYGLGALLALGAGFAARGLVLEPTPVDRALPLLLVFVVGAAWFTRHSPIASWVAALVPVIAAVVLFAPNGIVRAALIGLLIATILGIAVRSVAVNASLPIPLALLFSAAGSMLVSGLVLAPGAVEPWIVVAGSILLIPLLSLDGRVGLSGLAFSVALAVITPQASPRTALFAAAVASTVFLFRKPGLLSSALVILVCVATATWALPLAAVAIFFVVVTGWRGDEDPGRPMIALPPIAANAVWALRALAFAPRALLDSTRAPLAFGMAALTLLIGACLTRPVLALLYTFTAAVWLVSAPRNRLEERGALPTVAGALAMVALFPWSGILGVAFPLPVPSMLLLSLSAMIAATILLRLTPLGGVIPAIALIAFVFTSGARAYARGDEVVLRPGEAITLEAGKRSRAFHLSLGGDRLRTLDADVTVGSVEFVDVTGAAYVRKLTADEIADVDATSRASRLGSKNIPLRRPAGAVRGWGRDAELEGRTLIGLRAQQNVDVIRVSASAELPRGATLRLHGWGVEEP